MSNLLNEMLVMQDKLNEKTNGSEWKTGVTNNGKLINWRRCIYMECAELMESFAWKHWKSIDAAIDEANAKIEIVDIWHFVMSLGLEKGEVSEVCALVKGTSGFGEFCKSAYKPSNYNMYEILNEIEIIIHRTSAPGVDFCDLVRDFFSLALKLGVNLDELYRVYMGKNVLNAFRQDNGYKEGSYRKIWNGKEDNVVMNEILNSGVVGFEAIYSALREAYAAAK